MPGICDANAKIWSTNTALLPPNVYSVFTTKDASYSLEINFATSGFWPCNALLISMSFFFFFFPPGQPGLMEHFSTLLERPPLLFPFALFCFLVGKLVVL